MEQTRPRLRPVLDHSRLRSGLQSLRDQLPEVRETAESDDGLITVTLGAKNELLDLRLDPRVFRNPDSAALARAITQTVERAAEQVHQRLYGLTRQLLSDPDRQDPARNDATRNDAARNDPAGNDAAPGAVDPAFDPILADLDRKIAGKASS